MPKVPNCKGGYYPRKNGSVQVKYPLGWNEAKEDYDVFNRDVGTEAEAIVLLKSINDFIFHGGKVSDIPEFVDGPSKKNKKDKTVNEFAEEFISLRKRSKQVADRTIDSDREGFRRVKPYIGDMLLKDVTPEIIESTYASMMSDGADNLNGYTYTGTTTMKSHAFLSAMFKKARYYNHIDSNPMDRVSAPKKDTKEKRSLTKEQARSLIAEITSNELTAKSVGVLLGIGSGLRLSEMLAVTWRDYDGCAVLVNKSLLRDKQDSKSPKNEETRLVPCIPILIQTLDKWKAQQQRWFAEHGLEWSEDVPIVNSTKGTHILQKAFNRWYKIERVSYPIPDDFVFHELRHTYVSLLSRECHVDDRTTREMSGHKDAEAFGTYTHTNTESQIRAANQLGALLSPTAETASCGNCSSWGPSPQNPCLGACWASGAESLSATSLDHACQIGKFSHR